MNRIDEVTHGLGLSMGYKVKGELELAERTGSKMPRWAKTPPSGEARPAKTSGFRENKRFDVEAFKALHVSEGLGAALGVSGWVRHGVYVISTRVVATAPDGSGDSIEQWHVSISREGGHPGNGGRPSDGEVKQALACFGLVGADEDNHEPGMARHFWQPVDPARRVACECKTDEDVIVEADGLRWTTPKTGECRGCTYERRMAKECDVWAPCPLHRDDRVDALAYGIAASRGDLELDADGNVKQARWGPSKLAAIVPIVRDLEALKLSIASAVSSPRTEQEFFERQLATICTAHESLTGRVCELPNGHPPPCVFAEEALALAQDAMEQRATMKNGLERQLEAIDPRAPVEQPAYTIGRAPEVLVDATCTFTSDEVVAQVRERDAELKRMGAEAYDAVMADDPDKAIAIIKAMVDGEER